MIKRYNDFGLINESVFEVGYSCFEFDNNGCLNIGLGKYGIKLTLIETRKLIHFLNGKHRKEYEWIKDDI